MNTSESEPPSPTSIINCSCCRASHIKCNRGLPACSNCLRRNIQCQYPQPKKRGRPSTTELPPSKKQITSLLSLAIEMNDRFNGDEGDSQHDPSPTSTSREENVEEDYIETTIPRSVPLPAVDKSFEGKVTSAIFLSSRALAFLHGPDDNCSHQMSQQFYRMYQASLAVSCPKAADIRDIQALTMKLPRARRLEVADSMFLKAKSILLHPDIYPHIANNVQLADTCHYLAYYILGKSGRLSEAKVFMNNVKVYLKDKKAILDAPVGMENDSQERFKTVVRKIFLVFYGGKLNILANEMLSTNVTPHHFIRMIDAVIRTHKGRKTLFNSDVSSFTFPTDVFTLLKGFISEKFGMDRLLSITKLCDDLYQGISRAAEQSSADLTPWLLLVLSLELGWIKMEIQSSNYNSDTLSILKNMQLKYANGISTLLTRHIELFLYGGSCLTTVILCVCNVHIEYALELTLSPTADSASLSQVLGTLQADLIVVDRVIRKYDQQELKDRRDIIKNHISMIVSQLVSLQNNHVVEPFPMVDLNQFDDTEDVLESPEIFELLLQ